MTEPLFFSTTEGADYLAVSADKIIWFKDAEAEPEEPGDACSAEWSMIACGWQTGVIVTEGDIDAEDLSHIAEGIVDKPIAGYPIVRVSPSIDAAAPSDRRAERVTIHATTPLVDPGLSGLFEVRYVVGAVGLAYSPGIRGYQIFVTVPHGYVVVIVAYEDGVRVAAVLRPADKPPHLPMMAFLDLAIEALGIEPLDHEVDLRAQY
jgi:hypothetical protein